ncbi:MAG TPA: hypothetical protein VGN82_19515 [Bosea sp. (in: a-proteobacteria)]|jgi:hypothetical protein|uniref:hypothetical protein n=1 Tax=Bosea sp. (in: a-proteobacteria) TaxID=1871050 RepID=UPI002E0E5AE1|nr:hypothetical protein [Bosea sp. (in: a-proteobacteria)]
MAELKMPKPLRIAGLCILAGVAILIAVEFASPPHRTSVAATATETMSPLDIMIRNDESIPADFWDAS